jgi:hypothetical protein
MQATRLSSGRVVANAKAAENASRLRAAFGLPKIQRRSLAKCSAQQLVSTRWQQVIHWFNWTVAVCSRRIIAEAFFARRGQGSLAIFGHASGPHTHASAQRLLHASAADLSVIGWCLEAFMWLVCLYPWLDVSNASSRAVWSYPGAAVHHSLERIADARCTTLYCSLP